MGFATHLGPWLLGTVKDTTGTTAGSVRNTGTTIVCQTKSISFGDTTADTTAFALPAGALITAVQMITPTTAFGAGTITIKVGSTTLVNAATLPTALGVTALTIATTGGAVANNVGTTDQLVTFTLASSPTLGTSTLVIAYTVRGSDGVGYPVGNQN
jgi:hypothetical protein